MYRWRHSEWGEVITSLDAKHPEQRSLLEELLKTRRGTKLVDAEETVIRPSAFVRHRIVITGDNGEAKELNRLVVMTTDERVITTCSPRATDDFFRLLYIRRRSMKPMSAPIEIRKWKTLSGYTVATFVEHTGNKGLDALDPPPPPNRHSTSTVWRKTPNGDPPLVQMENAAQEESAPQHGLSPPGNETTTG